MLKNSLENISNYFIKKIEFDFYWNVYQDLISLENLTDDQIEFKQKINKIIFSLDDKKIILSENKTTLGLNFLELYTKASKLSIDDSTENLINSKSFKQNVVLLNHSTKFNEESLIGDDNTTTQKISKYIQKINTNSTPLSNKYDSTLFWSFISLLNEKNKTIIIDGVYKQLSNQSNETNNILEDIRKHNSVFILER